MPSTVKLLTEKQLIRPPSFLPSNTHYECIMGSIAYGCSNNSSDYDIMGWAIPSKEIVFPHLAGYISGFGQQPNKFEQYQQHHIFDKDALGGKGREYDLQIYNIVKYFQLCMDNNPNVLESLFVPRECIVNSTQIGEMVREKRHMFVHKGVFHRMKGYSYAQQNKLTGANITGKRLESIKKWGYNIKAGYHIVRLCDECQQLLESGDMDLRRAKEQLKSIRRGEWTENDIRQWFQEKEKQLEKLYETSSLPHGPNQDKIKQLLLDCLEHHYGDLSSCVVTVDAATKAIQEIQDTIDKYKLIS